MTIVNDRAGLRSAGVTGLVLAGGGFKGAYQIGAWRALRQLGFTQFDVIAGTSAGALNAALVAADNLAAAERVWLDEDVVRFAPAGLIWYLLAFAFLLGPIVLPLVLMGVAIVDWWARGTSPEILAWVSAGLGVTGFTVVGVIRLKSLSRRVFFTFDANTLLLAELLVFALVITSVAAVPGPVLGPNPCRSDAPYGLCAVSWVVVAACLPFGIACGVFGIRALTRARTSQVLANEGIVTELARVLGDLSAIRQRVRSVFITTARGQSIVDPFRPNLKMESRGGENRRSIDLDAPGFNDVWVSEYYDLCAAASPAEAAERLNLSGAFPIAFKAGATPQDETIADGGLVDNVPLLPVVQAGADSIVMILLSPLRETRETLETGLIERWIDHRIPSLSWEAAQALYRPWVRRVFGGGPEPSARAAMPNLDAWLPDRPVLQGKRITIIAPAQPLAVWAALPLFTGTLNLSRSFRQKCFTQGYADAMGTANWTTFEY